MSAKELAQELNVAPVTIWRLRKAGIIPRIKGTTYYNLDAVKKALESRSEFVDAKGQELLRSN